MICHCHQGNFRSCTMVVNSGLYRRTAGYAVLVIEWKIRRMNLRRPRAAAAISASQTSSILRRSLSIWRRTFAANASSSKSCSARARSRSRTTLVVSSRDELASSCPSAPRHQFGECVPVSGPRQADQHRFRTLRKNVPTLDAPGPENILPACRNPAAIRFIRFYTGEHPAAGTGMRFLPCRNAS